MTRRMNFNHIRHKALQRRSGLLTVVLLAALLLEDQHRGTVQAFSPSATGCSSRNAFPRQSTAGCMATIHSVSSRLTSTTSSNDASATQEQDSLSTTSSSSSSTLTTNDGKSWTDDGFVFGLDGSGLDRPTGRTSQVVVEGDSLETQPYQQVMVFLTFAGHGWFLSQAFAAMLAAQQGSILAASIQALALTTASWVLADFGSGVLHWSVDNYGNGRTPIFGSIIAAFQGHHSAPWTITERSFCNNVYKLCVPFGVATMAVVQFLLCGGKAGAVTWFMTTFCAFEILSQEFHKWSHQLPSETPGWVNQLQKWNLTVPRQPHALHHMAPFEGNYCIISGICNQALDQSGFFRRMERLVYRLNGVEPNAWKLDPELRAKTLRGDYSLPVSSSSSSS